MNGPLVVHAHLNPAMWAWSCMLMNCTAKAYEINKSRMVRLGIQPRLPYGTSCEYRVR